MLRRVYIAAVTTTAIMLPVAAGAQTLTQRYEAAYHAVARQDGRRAPGRDIVRYGLAPDGRRATRSDVAQSITVLDRFLHLNVTSRAPAPAVQSSTASPSTSAGASTQYAIPAYIVQCESGGNWSAVNPTSGAGGAYQIMPSTWAAYGGTGTPQDASPAEQSAIAAKIWASVGSSAWSCS